jgi:hypothetical protein
MPPEIEILVTDWFRRVRESQRLHYECATYYSRLNYLLGIPTIVLAAGVGTAVFASFDKLSVGYVKICLGLVSITAAVLSSLQTFLGFGQRADRHRFIGSKYGALRRSLEFLKTFPPANDGGLQRELEKVKKEMDDLAQNAPHVPSWLKSRIGRELKSQEHLRVFHLTASKAESGDVSGRKSL